jgi:BspA type Leucine rich repeat region (6 copies)
MSRVSSTKPSIRGLSIALLLIALPAGVRAQLTYTNTGSSVVITGYSGPDSVDIPAVIEGLPVTEIGSDAFRLSTVTNVTIPNSVIIIASGAFDFCDLYTVTIPDSVTSIGSGAFFGSYRLTDASIGSGVTNINLEAFDGCRQLTNITVAGSNPAFSSLDGVLFNKSQTMLIQYPAGKVGAFTIPNSVTDIGDYAFNASRLENIILPAGVTQIGTSALFDCESLTNITVDPSNMAYAGTNGVLFNKSLTTLIQYPMGSTNSSYDIPAGVTRVGNSAFQDCNSLSSVTIPDSVTNIGSVAFYDCTGLTSVTLGTGVSNIDYQAFGYCQNLTAAYFHGDAPFDNGNAFNSDPAIVYRLPGTAGWGATFGGAPVKLLTPRLTIGQLGTDVIVTWPTNFGSFTLESAKSLVAPVTWETNSSAPVLLNGVNTVTSPISGVQQFYRLEAQ